MEEGQDWIPVEVRAWVYRILTIVLGLNSMFGFFSEGAVGKILSIASLFGFGMAAVHTPTKK